MTWKDDGEADAHDFIGLMPYWAGATDDGTRVNNLRNGRGVPALNGATVFNHGGATELNLFDGLDPSRETTDYNPGAGEQLINV